MWLYKKIVQAVSILGVAVLALSSLSTATQALGVLLPQDDKIVEFTGVCEPVYGSIDYGYGSVSLYVNGSRVQVDNKQVDVTTYSDITVFCKLYDDEVARGLYPRLRVDGTVVELQKDGDSYRYVRHISDWPSSGRLMIELETSDTKPYNNRANFTINAQGDPVDFFIGEGTDMTMIPPEGGSVGYICDLASTQVTFKVSTLFISKCTSLSINSTDFSDAIPTTQEEKLEAFNEQHTEFTITVTRSSSYVIDVVAETDRNPAVGNFLWSYQEKDRGTDDFIDHGRIEFVRALYGDEVIVPASLEPGSARDWSEDPGIEGGAVFPAGSLLTVRLIPEHGMQLTSFGVNDSQFDVGESPMVYTFEVKPGNFHLCAGFTQVADVVSSSAGGVSGGSIVVSDADVPAGSAVLSVAPAAVNPTEEAAFEAAATGAGYEVTTAVDLNLSQVINKGTNDVANAWTASLGSADPLAEPAQVTLSLSGGSYSDAVVFHEEHDGSLTRLDTTYDQATNAVTFESSGYSNYVVATKPIVGSPVFRLYNPNSGEHFYTTNAGEYDAVKAAGWVGEGIAWSSPTSGDAPVFRLYNQYGGEHHYTRSVNERTVLVGLGWTDEGVAFHDAPRGAVQVMRLYNPNQFACNHLFTTSRNEADTIVRLGWIDEGIAWNAL